ncbi:phosphonopyruvate decarboxylase [Candidatus Roizmanbacteria bacterium RIFCSPLOWO2_12_FULL_40_12]|uniref:Phosphonopyruvate decarboxylase n=1 Tax=Candidatus Roizmanbacteria bacterium RIFCSPLOWO2_01_FULL_40_42 TaxID=1802066 RepID=A0A1F7J5E0_9BACT|nr:MAG: phosphonopyruvate decarboxylase [Candidatus Roizmanbacteria bacterium RIFCSPHIGHO2_01_FULL_40_98]OGK28266.1 MAG: phosphonopyruvate decarboxylase [Candidatus Roizmanbacteria bacterium RIFCSPHIGHO2_02_FULL_40_53]OGK30502.1 MAG: phosphonopyruvate decarboxylase [Candidatus Roizmanbacteria bacterium RIFCSPHIGHO2_12_41_18]OGK36916.1 MAG: phosphonopyruvate decarboxylase [Candidatus Roizmanbacteria bacterium RIFCSPHIGHO2_12_FULL_40_130]OGK50822.1 MAG: phosphonopyruvate decarboxylase [Candidatus
MINPKIFFKILGEKDIQFYTGVPDSVLKEFCAYVVDHIDTSRHVIAANEGNAVAIATGYYLSTGKPALVYLQNSGLGNAVNPLTSLTSSQVYGIPILLLIGWRGEPGKQDEPQHKPMGKVQNKLLKILDIPYAKLGNTKRSASSAVRKAQAHFKKKNSPFAIIVSTHSFSKYKSKDRKQKKYPMTREAALITILSLLGKNDIVVSTTGKTSRELYKLRISNKEDPKIDFLCVGNMGHASSIALGLAKTQPKKTIWCLDGDGSMIMHMGSMAVIGQQKPKHFVHVLFNNFVHDSVGGQPTAADSIDFTTIAKGNGYISTASVKTGRELKKELQRAKRRQGPVFVEVLCQKGSRKNLGRPLTTPQENKASFMQYIKQIKK